MCACDVNLYKDVEIKGDLFLTNSTERIIRAAITNRDLQMPLKSKEVKT